MLYVSIFVILFILYIFHFVTISIWRNLLLIYLNIFYIILYKILTITSHFTIKMNTVSIAVVSTTQNSNIDMLNVLSIKRIGHRCSTQYRWLCLGRNCFFCTGKYYFNIAKSHCFVFETDPSDAHSVYSLKYVKPVAPDCIEIE